MRAILVGVLLLYGCGGVEPVATRPIPIEEPTPQPSLPNDLAPPPVTEDRGAIVDPTLMHTYVNAIVPRLQWNENFGYCGETSFISAGMNLGQYCSQFTARSLASPGVPQHEERSQLLLGVNEVAAATAMRLDGFPFDTSSQTSTPQYLAWVKENTLAGRTVIIGVFNNGIRLREWSNPNDGDPNYDHIGPILGIASRRSLQHDAGTYYPEDILTFDDNGLYGPGPEGYQFRYSYHFGPFQGTRQQANQPHGPLYMERDRPPNYAYAVTGVLDFDGATIPVRLTASRHDEPQIGHHSNIPPTPEPLRLTATVTLPDPAQSYNLYLYDDFARVPTSGFNAAAGQSSRQWVIPANSGGTFVVSIEVMTDTTAVFRAVPTTAP